MQKIKLIVTLLIANCLLLIGARSVEAATVVQIQTLPGYINYTDFKLSCTTDGATAQFYSKKDGGSYAPFGSLIDLTNPSNSCQVQVTGTQFGSEGKFWFKVSIDGDLSENSFTQTSTTLDTTAPGGVSDFGKDRMNGGTTYRVHWKNPSDSDFSKVFVYRGTSAGFSADNDHKIGEFGGNPGDTMSWDDNGLDSTKEYYYVLRALDKARNSSGLVGDAGTTSVTATPSGGVLGASTGSFGKVAVLPKEEEVLGGAVEGTPIPVAPETPASSTGALGGLSASKKLSIAALVLLILGSFYFFARRRK